MSGPVVVLSGGTGTVKLVKGMDHIGVEDLVVVTNTGDDFDYYGLRISPDTDAVLYALAGLLDETKMWGVRGDSFVVRDTLRTLDTEDNSVVSWFNLGDVDLTHCLYRTYLMEEGHTLTEVTKVLAERLAVNPTIIPMSDDWVQTYFHTPDGVYHLEEYFIRLGASKPIVQVEYRGSTTASVSEVLLDALRTARSIIIGPSNPISSIAPILAIPRLRTALEVSDAQKIVVSPLVGTSAISGPANHYLSSLGYEVSPTGIYDYYSSVADIFLFDKTDEEQYNWLVGRGGEEGKTVRFTNILLPDLPTQSCFAQWLVKEGYC